MLLIVDYEGPIDRSIGVPVCCRITGHVTEGSTCLHLLHTATVLYTYIYAGIHPKRAHIGVR